MWRGQGRLEAEGSREVSGVALPHSQQSWPVLPTPIHSTPVPTYQLSKPTQTWAQHTTPQDLTALWPRTLKLNQH
jgi:hypothetical protein